MAHLDLDVLNERKVDEHKEGTVLPTGRAYVTLEECILILHRTSFKNPDIGGWN